MKRPISFILSIIMIASLLTTCVFVSFAKETGGQCGDNIGWSYDFATKTIKLTGTGEMYDYNNISVPWASFQSEIRAAIVGDGITSLGTCAFCYCSALTSITLPDSIKSIGMYASYQSSKLTTVFFSGSLTDLSVITVGKNNNPLTRARCYSLKGKCGNKLRYEYAPDTHTLTVSGIGAMYDYSEGNTPWYPFRTEINNVVTEENVTAVGSYAFCDCTSLSGVTISEDTTKLGAYVFYGCTVLWEITIPESIQVIPNHAFHGCTGLNYVYLPDTLTAIGEYAFWSTPIREINIPDRVKSIGKGAFGMCHAIRDVIIPYGVEEISDYLFYNCFSLQSLAIPGSVTKIGEYAFTVCHDLSDIYFVGSEEEWNALDKNPRGNILLDTPTVHYFTRCRAYGHEYEDGICLVCGGTDPHYVEPTVRPGDLDGDKVISMKDSRLMKQYLVGAVKDGDIIFDNADIDSDGIITLDDMKALRLMLLD